MSTAHPELRSWKPGQSGNPKGSSRKLKLRRTLRQAAADLLDSKLPPELVAKLAEELRDLAPDKVADAIVLRLALFSLAGKAENAIAAMQQLRQLEAPPEGQAAAEKEAPRLPTDLERRRKVAEALQEAGQILKLVKTKAPK